MRVSVKDLLRNFSLFSDKALNEPVVITKNGRDRLVLLSYEEYGVLRDMLENSASRDETAKEDLAKRA